MDNPTIEKHDASSGCSNVEFECVMDYTNEFTTYEIFKSRDRLIKWARDVGRRLGFVIVIKTSDTGQNGRKPRVVLACERSGRHRIASKKIEKGEEKKTKETGTKKCECPFMLKGVKLSTDDDWMLEVVCGTHNHSAAEDLEGHSFAGRLSEEEASMLVDLSKSMVRPKDILTRLKKKDELNASTMKTVYNARHRFRVIEKAGRSQLQQLLGKLAEQKYHEWHRSCDDTNTVNDLFWTHPDSITLLHTFPGVLIMDCTYKTNRYRLPLLEIVGVTSTEKTFSVAFAYLQSEREDNYEWALRILCGLMDGFDMPQVIVTDRELALMKAIANVFPTSRHFLCRWHINKNILKSCKKHFKTKEKWEEFIMSWNILVLSSTEGAYNKYLKSIQEEFSEYQAVLKYIADNWLDPYKDRFVAAWTDTSMHFGNMTSNRAESAHARLKKQLGSSQGNFADCWEKMDALYILVHTDIKASFQKSLTVVQHSFKPAEFKDLRGFISISALEMVLAESKRANQIGVDASACGCVIRRTHGLPCAHEIAEYKRINRPIPLECVHDHWKRLSMALHKKIVKLSCQSELELIRRRFEEMDPIAQRQFLKKVRELADPQTTFLIEPTLKVQTRGRPKGKVDTSTRRDPSAFELVDDNVANSGTTKQLPQKRKRRAKDTVLTQNRYSKQISYLSEIPEGVRPYIKEIKNVESDGNCGFRAISALLGNGEDGWVQVRKDLFEELHSNEFHYVQLYGSKERVEELAHALSFYETNAPVSRWMTLPDMGHLIASHYNVVLYHLSLMQCLTYLPLRSMPETVEARKEIGIAFISGCHYVQVFLKSGHPVPPIANKWERFHYDGAAGWAETYTSRINHFRKLVSSNVATRETINLD